jgi:hypothetical protein
MVVPGLGFLDCPFLEGCPGSAWQDLGTLELATYINFAISAFHELFCTLNFYYNGSGGGAAVNSAPNNKYPYILLHKDFKIIVAQFRNYGAAKWGCQIVTYTVVVAVAAVHSSMQLQYIGCLRMSLKIILISYEKEN